MAAFLSEYGLFLAKTITTVVAVLTTIASIAAIRSKGKPSKQAKLTRLNAHYTKQKLALLKHCHDKQAAKACRKHAKSMAKQTDSPRLFVLDFEGDLKASHVPCLREEVTAILLNHRPNDAVLIRIQSPGGMVHAYGLAASQLDRLREAGLHITASIDKIAASGGYLMAAVAHHIIAAPFAIVGSIGVVAQMPNFHRFLQKHDVDFEQITAGQYKRTLTVLGKNTSEGRKKFQEDVNMAHALFKTFLTEHRPSLVLDQVATGEYWHAAQAMDLGLVDALGTSDDFLLKRHEHTTLIHVACTPPKSLFDKLGGKAQSLWQGIWTYPNHTSF